MKLQAINQPDELDNDKLKRELNVYEALIVELDKRELPNETVQWINERTEWLNKLDPSEKGSAREVRKYRSRILMKLEKEHKLVPKNYYRNLWLSLGLAAFGVPIGVGFGLSMDNLGLMGIGFPIGMAIGYVLGMSMDKRAAKENRQLNVQFQ